MRQVNSLNHTRWECKYHFVASTVAPVASGWSDCRVGLSPTGKAPPLLGARQFRSFRILL